MPVKLGTTYARANRLIRVSAGCLIEKDDLQSSKNIINNPFKLLRDFIAPEVQLKVRCGLAQAYLFQNDLVNARATIEAALQYDVPKNNHNASALHGIIALRQGDEVAARGAFVRAIGQADEILSKTAEYYSALDAKGLALCGIGDLRWTGRRTVDSAAVMATNVTVDRRKPSKLRKARKIAPHAGVVKSVLRLFDELVKCDEEGMLKDVRKAVEGAK